MILIGIYGVSEIFTNPTTSHSSTHLESALNQSDRAFLLIKLSNNSIVDFNETALHMSGYSHEEMTGLSISELLHSFSDYQNWDDVVNSLTTTPSSTFTGEYRTVSGKTCPTIIEVEIITMDEEKFVLVKLTDDDRSEHNKSDATPRTTGNRYRTLFEEANVGIAEVTFDEEWIRVNKKLEEILGYTEDELQSMQPCESLNHPDELERDRRKARKLREGEIDSYTVEKRFETKQGDYVWTQLSATKIEDSTRDEPYMISVIQDINKRKETETELTKRERQFRQFANTIDVVIWISSPDKNVTYVNPAFEDVWGMPAEELYADIENFLERIHPDDREQVRQAMFEDQKTGNYNEEYRIVRPDGEVRWIHDQAYPIEDENGNVIRIVGIAQDITNRKRIQEEKETFFDLTLDLFALADFEGNFLEINKAFVETLGYTRSKLLSEPFLNFVHPDDRKQTEAVLESLGEGKEVTNFENRYRTKDGDYRWLSWRARPKDDIVFAVARDVTDRKKFEQQLQSIIEEKETLLKEVHHRVKNNLQVVISLLDLKRRKIDNPQVDRSLIDSRQRIKSMALIHELLYQSESLSSINFEDYLDRLIDRLLVFRDPDPENPEIEVEVDLDDMKLESAIPCGLMLNELISNALEYGRDSDDRTHIEVSLTEDDGEVVLEVADNGEGFPSSFDIEDSDTLGMDVVKSLAEYELQGTLEIENNDGARVTVTFPLE